MGVGWIVELVSWFYNGENKPWIFLGLDIIMHLQAVALFMLLCCNERTLQKLQDEYPKSSGEEWIFVGFYNKIEFKHIFN